MSYKFTSIALSSLTNPKAAQYYHYRLAELVKGEVVTKFNVPAAVLSGMQAADERLTDLVNTFRGSEQTPLMQSWDADRDGKFRAMWWLLKAAGTSADERVRAAGVKVAPMLTTYPLTICSEDYGTETPHIRGFILDIRKYDEAVLTAIGISTEMISALENANEQFQTAFSARNSDRSTATYGEIKLLRNKIDDQWNQIAPYILIAANDSTHEFHEDAITLMNVVNEYSNYFDVYYIAKSSSEKGATDNTDPAENNGDSGTSDSGSADQGSGDSGNGGISDPGSANQGSGTDSGGSGGSDGGGNNHDAII